MAASIEAIFSLSTQIKILYSQYLALSSNHRSRNICNEGELDKECKPLYCYTVNYHGGEY